MSYRFFALALLTVGAAARADPLTVTGNVDITSDYAFRGVSISKKTLVASPDFEPAVQASVEVDHKSGAYVGLWSSSVGDQGPGGSVAELDIFSGYKATEGPISYDLGLTYYTFPGAAHNTKTGFLEAQGSLTYTIAFTSVKAGLAWRPKSGNAARDGLYFQADLGQVIPKTPFTLRAHIGHTLSSLGSAQDYYDYSAGVDISHRRWTLNLAYIGTDLSRAKAGTQYNAVRPKPQATLYWSF